KLIEEKGRLSSNAKELQLTYEEHNQELNQLKEKYKEEFKRAEYLEKDILNEEKIIDETKGNIIDTFNLMTDRKSKINNLNSFQKNIDNRISQVNKEIKEIENDKTERVKIIDSLLKEEKLKKEEVKDISKELVNSNKKIKELQKDLSNLYDKSNENRGNLQGKISNHRFLVNMEESYEGFYRSVKNVMKACKKDSILGEGIVGVVADLIKVEDKYEKTIGVALGSSLQNIVTETEDDAKKIINYLKEKRLGRVTFLPLTSIKGKCFNIRKEDKEKFNIIGLASQLVVYDEKYKNIFEYLLGRTIVVENIDWGIKAAK